MFDFHEIAPIVLLLLSELLPFLQSTQANGIIQFIIIFIKAYTEQQAPSTTTTNIYTNTASAPPPPPPSECHTETSTVAS